MINNIRCETCEAKLRFERIETLEAFGCDIDLTIFNVFEKIDAVINEYLVFICPNCNVKYKYTYKRLHELTRMNIFKNLLKLITQGQFNVTDTSKNHVLIYCGKCNGYDGKGSCTVGIFNKCAIKIFPIMR